jgi:hypothetical protein
MRRLNESLRIIGRGSMDFPSPHSSLTPVVTARREDSGSADTSKVFRRKAPHNAKGRDAGT